MSSNLSNISQNLIVNTKMSYEKEGHLQKLSKSTWSSYTRREIEMFWREKKLVEEEHMFHAIKASARLRARHLCEEDYLIFLESLKEIKIMEEDVASNQEICVGVKDWWTKSKYAYLNEPAIGHVRPSRRSNYKPNNILLCNYKLLPSQVSTASTKAPILGVF